MTGAPRVILGMFQPDRKSTRLNSSHVRISYAVFCLKKKRTENILHRNFTRRQVAIQNRVDSNIGISQITFIVNILNLFSRSNHKNIHSFPTRRSSDLAERSSTIATAADWPPPG